MEAFTPWLTPALLVALVAWLRSELISRTEKLDKRFDGVDKRFDGVTREIADLRERMARLEGALEGFLAGRRDRDAA
jgi:predicted  nucleic acid-binding Zn-ribbon protein